MSALELNASGICWMQHLWVACEILKNYLIGGWKYFDNVMFHHDDFTQVTWNNVSNDLIIASLHILLWNIKTMPPFMHKLNCVSCHLHIDGLAQDYSKAIANALELL